MFTVSRFPPLVVCRNFYFEMGWERGGGKNHRRPKRNEEVRAV